MTRLEQLLQLLSQEPNDDFLNHALAMEYMGVGKYAEAVAAFENLLQRNPEYLPSHYQLGQALEKLNENEKAISVYKKGIELANKQKNRKALGELNEALWLLED
jgi:tetratricopeptide (TPR) repeat protein